MDIDSSEVLRLLDRLDVLAVCWGSKSLRGEVVSRGRFARCYELNGKPLPEYPTDDALRQEPQALGKQLAIAAVNADIDDDPFNRLAIEGLNYLAAHTLAIHAQKLRTKIAASDAPQSAELPPLTEETAAVMRYLAKRHPVHSSLEVIADGAKISKATAKKSTDELITMQFALRPAGPNKGTVATREGLAAAFKLSTKSVQT